MLKKIFKKDEAEPETAAAEISEAPETAPEAPAAEESKIKKGFFQGAWEATKKLALTPVDPWFEAVARGLDRTRQSLVMQVVGLFKGGRRIDEDFWEELEDILISSDVGTTATDRVVDTLRRTVKDRKLTSPESLLDELKGVIHEILCPPDPARTGGAGPEEPEAAPAASEERGLNIESGRINVILMVGVNGSGKTTTTAKLAHQLTAAGHKVMLAAADTFRAAAIEQLEVWGKRLDLDVIRHKEGSDPAAVVYDALNAAKARKVDVLIIDTAGRLHNKANLMEELKKIRRVTEKELPGAPHEVLLVLDATTGQNALAQARVFHEAVELSGLVLCKLDGTAKGGIVVAIASEFQIPVKYIGVGEAVEDLRPFRPRQFMLALFGENEEATAS